MTISILRQVHEDRHKYMFNMNDVLNAWRATPIIMLDADYRVLYKSPGWWSAWVTGPDQYALNLAGILKSMNICAWATPEAHMTGNYDPSLQIVELENTRKPRLLSPNQGGRILNVNWTQVDGDQLSVMMLTLEQGDNSASSGHDAWFPHKYALEQTSLLDSVPWLNPHSSDQSEEVFLGIFSSDGASLLFQEGRKDSPLSDHRVKSIEDVGICPERLAEGLKQSDTYVQIVDRIPRQKQCIARIHKFKTHEQGSSFLACRIDDLYTRIDHELVASVFPQLTPKEAEVCSLLATGNNLKEVAQVVDRAHGTVTIQARSAMQKLQVRSTIGLACLVCKSCSPLLTP